MPLGYALHSTMMVKPALGWQSWQIAHAAQFTVKGARPRRAAGDVAAAAGLHQTGS